MLFFHRQLYLYLIICKFTHYIHTKKLSLGNFQYSENHIVLIMSKYDKAGVQCNTGFITNCQCISTTRLNSCSTTPGDACLGDVSP